MFKKIEIWILYLVVLLGIPVTIGFGSVVRHEILGGKKFGLISKTALFLAEMPKTVRLASNQSAVHELKDRFPSLNGFNGTPNLSESYLLLAKYDGDLKEGIVQLIDLKNFNVLHTWNPDFDEFNKSIEKIDIFKNLKRDDNDGRALMRHPLFLKDGSLVFSSTYAPLKKIDACSNLLFQTNQKTHHSIEKDKEGNLWVPIHIYPKTLPEEIIGKNITYLEDGILKLSSSGKILFKKSLSQIFIENNLKNYLYGNGDSFIHDPLHLNDIQPVEFDGEYWKKGDLFLSLRNQSMIVLYRPSTNKIVWKRQSPFLNQHDIDILDDHRISIFDNHMLLTYTKQAIVDGSNQVLIYNFKTDQFSPYLKNSLIENDVRTATQGLSEILPNGDLFVEEQNYGRILYFNSDGTLRWTYLNKSKSDKVHSLSWSRIMSKSNDILNVKNFLNLKVECKK